MSTDRVVPERWRPAANKAREAVRDGYGPKTAICWNVYLEVIEELGTAESLVRDLARSLQEVMDLIGKGVLVRNVCDDGSSDWAIRMLPLVSTLGRAQALLESTKELRAPETRAREKSGSVLRQEGK